jgi:hypothetical protein
MKECIEQFIRQADLFLDQADDLSRCQESWRDDLRVGLIQMRADLLATGRELLAKTGADGKATAGLLAFINAVEDLEYPVADLLWPNLKVALQQTIMRLALPTVAVEDEDKLDKAPVVKDQGNSGDDRPENYLPAKQIEKLFCLTPKRRRVFLDAHPSIRTGRPPSRKGTPHPHRLNVHILDFIKAIRNDDLIAGNPAVAQRIENNLQRAQLAQQIEDVALKMFLGK